MHAKIRSLQVLQKPPKLNSYLVTQKKYGNFNSFFLTDVGPILKVQNNICELAFFFMILE